jgi:TonB-dependent SusC/RagA subfamily outer membrane receptor
MRSKFKWIFTLAFALIVQLTFAQEKTIKGVVSGPKGPISGVNVLIKGTKVSTQTDFDGSYTIKVKTGDVLLYSFIGMDNTTRTVSNASKIDVTMRDGQELAEVVVTGQGIKKAKKALGFGQTTIKSEELASKPSTDVARALTGKAPGVNIQQTSGMSGSGTNIIIRGYSSITGSNQPLFVVDGVPFNSETNSDGDELVGAGGDFLSGATNASSRFLDLDPNNVESISILKGLSATTLYGSAGRNGVILVTTKSGKSGKTKQKMEVNMSQSLYFTNIASLPEYQDNYGNGFDNNFIKAFSNWGPRFGTIGTQGVLGDGSVVHPYSYYGANIFPEYAGKTTPYVPYNNVKPFFRTGYVGTTSLNVSGSSEGTSFNINVGNTRDEGFIDNNNYKRLNLSMGGSTKLSNGFTFSSSLNYIKTDKSAPPTAAGFGSNSILPSVFANILYTPRSFDLFGLPYSLPKDYGAYPKNGSANYRVDIPNPRWTLANSSDDEVVRRIFGNFTTSYEINSWSNVSYRLALDNYTQRKKFYINKGNGQQFANDGYMSTSVRENIIMDHTLTYNFDTKISSSGKWNFDGTVGFNPKLDAKDYNYSLNTIQLLYGLFEYSWTFCKYNIRV